MISGIERNVTYIHLTCYIDALYFLFALAFALKHFVYTFLYDFIVKCLHDDNLKL